MANVQLQLILGAPNLSGIIQTTASLVPDPFNAPAYNSVDKQCNGNTGQYTQYSGVRQIARVGNYGGASSNQQQRELGVLPVVLVHLNQNIIIQPTDYMSLFNYDDFAKQQLGVQEVQRQTAAAKDYVTNFWRVAKAGMLFNNGFSWDAQGNILPPSGGSGVHTVNYNVPAGNQGQLDIFGTGNPIIATTWNNTLAKIPEQMSQLRKQSTYNTGYTATTAYYGANIPQFMTQNTFVQPYLARAQFPGMSQGNEFVSDGTLPERLLGFKWIDSSYAYWLDQNNAVQTFVGDDAVTFTPEPAQYWVSSLEGSLPIPERANIITPFEPTLQAAGIVEHFGQFAYGVQTVDPAGLKIVYGDTRLPILKIPNAVYIATVATGS